MNLPDNTILHLVHSSFLLKLHGIVMVFDYFQNTDPNAPEVKLDSEFFHLHDLAEEEVYVFVSHGHGDHFSPVIFEWRQQVPRINYILSYDIPIPSVPATRFKPGDEKVVGSIRVRAYASTDHGVAYSIYTHGRHIYFAGDNAFWNWDGDLDDDIYQRIALNEIDKRTPMDIAFQVCDPRLDGLGDGGIHIFARTFQPQLLIPIHSFGDYAFNLRAEKRLRDSGFAHRFWCVGGQGEVFSFF